MPVVVLLLIIIVAVLVGGAYNIGFEKGREAGGVDEAKRYKDKIKVVKKQVVED